MGHPTPIIDGSGPDQRWDHNPPLIKVLQVYPLVSQGVLIGLYEEQQTSYTLEQRSMPLTKRFSNDY